MNKQLTKSEDNSQYLYRTQGVCARAISFNLDDELKVKDVEFHGGCSGNSRGVSSLVEDMPASWVIERCKGIQCGFKSTSCPDQLSQALEQALVDRQA